MFGFVMFDSLVKSSDKQAKLFSTKSVALFLARGCFHNIILQKQCLPSLREINYHHRSKIRLVHLPSINSYRVTLFFFSPINFLCDRKAWSQLCKKKIIFRGRHMPSLLSHSQSISESELYLVFFVHFSSLSSKNSVLTRYVYF